MTRALMPRPEPASATACARLFHDRASPRQHGINHLPGLRLQGFIHPRALPAVQRPVQRRQRCHRVIESAAKASSTSRLKERPPLPWLCPCAATTASAAAPSANPRQHRHDRIAISGGTAPALRRCRSAARDPPTRQIGRTCSPRASASPAAPNGSRGIWQGSSPSPTTPPALARPPTTMLGEAQTGRRLLVHLCQGQELLACLAQRIQHQPEAVLRQQHHRCVIERGSSSRAHPATSRAPGFAARDSARATTRCACRSSRPALTPAQNQSPGPKAQRQQPLSLEAQRIRHRHQRRRQGRQTALVRPQHGNFVPQGFGNRHGVLSPAAAGHRHPVGTKPATHPDLPRSGAPSRTSAPAPSRSPARGNRGYRWHPAPAASRRCARAWSHSSPDIQGTGRPCEQRVGRHLLDRTAVDDLTILVAARECHSWPWRSPGGWGERP